MERQTLLAIVLSALVLFTYQAIFVAPQQVQKLKNSQSVATEEVKTINTSPSVISSNKPAEPTIPVSKTKDYSIESTNTNYSYTNMGGTLHNIEFFRNDPFPITDVLYINGFENQRYTGQKLDNKNLSLSYKDQNVQITKFYEFQNGNYQIQNGNFLKVRMEIKNLLEMSNLKNFNFTAFEIDVSRMDINQNSRNNILYEYSVYSGKKILRKGNANKFSDKNNQNGNFLVNWVGFRDHFNAFIVKPEFQTKSFEIKTDSDKQLKISIEPQDNSIAPGESKTYEFSIYAGPQDPWLMKKYAKGFEKIIAFSNFAIIEWIAQGIYYTTPFLHTIFKSWGVAIILISLLIYGITYPLTLKSMMSMRKMQEIQPKIAALRERFKNEPQKLNAEMIEIYRREKINPFGGCLPFLIQMPFFMALYQILWRAQYFQGQGFLWIKDLSQPDRLIIFPFYLPLFGNELNILPILTGGIMFVQQKISSKNIIVTDEQQAMQQKMMMYILPVMMACMFYHFASSWAVYFLIFYILSTISQWKISKLSPKANQPKR
jgi:YidC/Oxa1 family membrane protein insertase